MTEEVERIGDDWREQTGHTVRYSYAADRTNPGEMVNDIACGIGYGTQFFNLSNHYHGYDRPGVFTFDPGVGGLVEFTGCDLNDPGFLPDPCDVTCCFETLEHVKDPEHLAFVIEMTTERAVFVSVPTVPTVGGNRFHLHDFTVDDIPLLFPSLKIVDQWAQPEELAHVWHLEW